VTAAAPSGDVEALKAADARLATLGPTPFPLPIHGLEAVVAGAVRGLTAGDWWVPGLRERVGAVLRDVPVERLVDGFAGSRPYKVAPPTASPALRALHAVGLALAAGADATTAVLVHLGTGSVADGAFAEALNLAALRQARVIFLVALHPLEGAPVPRQSAATPAALAAAYGVPAVEVDGTDPEAVRTAVAGARGRSGPTLITARLKGPDSSS
jgi:TPP-dependent pyruvate/acetoin dehydrogenase alpha subunit